MLRRIKLEGSGKRRRVRSVRYRVTGFRDPGSGDWVSRDPRNGHYYRIPKGEGKNRKPQRRYTEVRPTQEMIAATDMIALEVEIDRGGDSSRVYYISVPGL